jgi:hypothetical protein
MHYYSFLNNFQIFVQKNENYLYISTKAGANVKIEGLFR